MQYECKICSARKKVVNVVPQIGYDENILECGHRFFTLVKRKTVGSALTELNEIDVFEGDLPCLIVFSDRKHVEYINEVLSVAEQSLRSKGFKPETF